MNQNQKSNILNSSKVEGILLVNKDLQKTSFSIISILRKITREKKIGHGGTLDPFASGVMVIFIGKKYTSKSQEFLEHDKEYMATVSLGNTTDSYDTESPLKFCSDKVPSLNEVEDILKTFQGEVLQTPPMFSAKKIKGKRLYKLARQGITVERAPLKVRINITLVSYNYPLLEINVQCSKGTYIRSLANDIGAALNTGAFLSKLTRTRSGPFDLSQCVDQNLLLTENFNINKWLKK